MKDIKGIERGKCLECVPPNECDEYLKNDTLNRCDYCHCPPVRHVKQDQDAFMEVIPVVEENDLNFIQKGTAEEFSEVLDTTITVGDQGAGASGNPPSNLLEKAIPLPVLSKLVEESLSSGDILWSNLIEETAQFYIRHPIDLTTKTSYKAVGAAFFEKYPKIKMYYKEQPWSFFTSRLSSKIRKLRMKRKSHLNCIHPKGKSREAIAVKRNKENKEPQKLGSPRSEVIIPDAAIAADIPALKKQLSVNENPALTKPLLRRTFYDRTLVIAKHGKNYAKVFEDYPILLSHEFLAYEVSLLLGKAKFEKMQSNLKEMFIMLASLKGNNDVNDLPTLWLFFEKKVGSFSTKEKALPTVKFSQDPKVFQQLCVSNPRSSPFLVCLKGGESAICGDEVRINIPHDNLLYCLTLLLGLYYVLELHFPLSYRQALASLSSVVLNDKYYKINSRAILFLEKFKKNMN